MELPRSISPMLARLVEEPFDDDSWQFEIKWDGIRAIAYRDGPRAEDTRILARSGRLITAEHPSVVAALAELPAGCVIDGEIVAFDEDGKPSFERVLRRRGKPDVPSHMVAFDLLWQDFEDWTARPLSERGAALADLLDGRRDTTFLTRSEPVVGQGRSLYKVACSRGLEGVVAKRLDSKYLPGARDDVWRKIKKHEEVWAVVLGFATDREDEPLRGKDLRSLIVAAAGDDGQLRVIGRVGAALPAVPRAALRDELTASTRERPLLPLDTIAEHLGERSIEGFAWVEPNVLVHVRFLEWSSHGNMRAPVLRAWRRAE